MTTRTSNIMMKVFIIAQLMCMTGVFLIENTVVDYCIIGHSERRYIFGDDWRTKLNFPLLHYYKSICEKNDVVRNMFIHPTQIAYQVWLSKKGKYDFAFYQGYHRRAYNGVNNIENQEFATRICKTIEKNMQSVHPDLPLRLVVVPDKPWLVRWEHFYTAVDIHGLDRPW